MVNIRALCSQKEWCTCDKQKKKVWKNKNYSPQSFEYFITFETSSIYMKFWTSKLYKSQNLFAKKKIHNPNYYAPFTMLQRYEIVDLK
jgi:hypothetical protein